MPVAVLTHTGALHARHPPTQCKQGAQPPAKPWDAALPCIHTGYGYCVHTLPVGMVTMHACRRAARVVPTGIVPGTTSLTRSSCPLVGACTAAASSQHSRPCTHPSQLHAMLSHACHTSGMHAAGSHITRCVSGACQHAYTPRGVASQWCQHTSATHTTSHLQSFASHSLLLTLSLIDPRRVGGCHGWRQGQHQLPALTPQPPTATPPTPATQGGHGGDCGWLSDVQLSRVIQV